MSATTQLGETLGDFAKDLRLNLSAVLENGVLNPAQTWGVALAVAGVTRRPELWRAVYQDATAHVDAHVIDDAKAAAALMAMNNIFYRFRHMVGKPVYATLPAQLRMTRIARPASNKVDFELFCLAVSAIHGCEACVVSHEKAVLEGGLSEAHVHAAMRIAATLHGVAVASALEPDPGDAKIAMSA